MNLYNGVSDKKGQCGMGYSMTWDLDIFFKGKLFKEFLIF